MTDPDITVRKMSAYLPVSEELLMDYGVIPDPPTSSHPLAAASALADPGVA